MDAPPSPSARRTLLLLVVIAGALAAAAIFQRDRALEQEYDDARARAELYTQTALRSAIAAGDLAGPLTEARRAAVASEVEPLILGDPAVARVRLWTPTGTLLFSTDAADAPGATSEDPAIGSAALGRAEDRIAVGSVSPRDHDAAGLTPLFQSFVPFRLRGSSDVGAVAEIEQFVAALESGADDPWWMIQVGASAAAVLLAIAAFVSVARGAKRGPAEAPVTTRGRSGRGREDAEPRSEPTARAEQPDGSAAAYASQLKEATAKLERLERQTPDERVAELREALRRSEAERALLRAGRPETTAEVELRALREALRDARSRATAAEALAAGGGDVSAVQQEIAAAQLEVERARERARLAEARAAEHEEQARTTAELAEDAERRIDQLEIKLQEVASSAMSNGESPELGALREELAAATARVQELERRLAEASASAQAAPSISDEVLMELERRVSAAEARSVEAEERLRAFENESADEGSRFRHTLGVRAAGRKLGAPAAAEPEVAPDDPDVALRKAISRGLRAPLTRAAGLTLSLQGAVDSAEGKSVVRQLSNSLRRLDQLTADLHDVDRITDGSLQLNRRRTDLGALLTTTLEEADLLHEDRLVRLDAEHVEVDVDPARMRQIVEGMLEAVKDRTRVGAAIVVRARTTDRGVMVSVEDDNKIPTEVGPELSLAARLAELHGSELLAEGSSFRIFLPPVEG